MEKSDKKVVAYNIEKTVKLNGVEFEKNKKLFLTKNEKGEDIYLLVYTPGLIFSKNSYLVEVEITDEIKNNLTPIYMPNIEFSGKSYTVDVKVPFRTKGTTSSTFAKEDKKIVDAFFLKTVETELFINDPHRDVKYNFGGIKEETTNRSFNNGTIFYKLVNSDYDYLVKNKIGSLFLINIINDDKFYNAFTLKTKSPKKSYFKTNETHDFDETMDIFNNRFFDYKKVSFRTLSNLPGGINKNDIFILSGGVYKNENGVTLPFDPSKEEKFFVKEYISVNKKEEDNSKFQLKDIIQSYSKIKSLISEDDRTTLLEQLYKFDITKIKNKNKVENIKLFILDSNDKKNILLSILDNYDYEVDYDKDEKKNKLFLDFIRDERFTKPLEQALKGVRQLIYK